MRSEKLNNEIDWVLGGLGAAHSLYLSIHVFLGRKKNPNNIWLGLLLFSLCIRILKSLLWLGYEHIPDWVLNLGFLAHSVTGPLLLIYIMGFVFGIQWRTWKILHFIPSILLLLFAKTLSLDAFWYRGGYTLLLVQQIVYSLGSLILLIKGYMGRDSLATPLSKKDWIWIMVVVMGVMFIQMTYFLNYILGWTPYILGPLVFPVFIYFLSFFGLRNPELFQRRFRDKKYANIQLSKKQMNTFVGSLVSHMEKERPYLKSDCTLGGVASDLHMPPYLLSYVINNEFGQNFPDYINSYRIDEAKRLLADASREKFKISSIAYDCGFNTLSAFNTWFKKIVGSTPSMYRKQVKDS